MTKINIKVSVLISCLALSILSCSKDENDASNQTNGKTTAVFNPEVTYGAMTDQDGNVYKTITIVTQASESKTKTSTTQTWMAENLRTTKYNDGSLIINTTAKTYPDGYPELGYGAYCNYNNTKNVDTIATFGRLYNWWAVYTGKIAPKGWHVPTNEEWNMLINNLGGSEVANSKLREIGTAHWGSNNSSATNEIGFTAIPAGSFHMYSGLNGEYGESCEWWSATDESALSAYSMILAYCTFYGGSVYDKHDLLTIRCVKD